MSLSVLRITKNKFKAMPLRSQRLITVVALLVFASMQSCTLTRIGVFFMPSVTDYKVFPCDTLHPSSSSSFAFAEAAWEDLPQLQRWVPAEYLKSARNLDEFLEQTKTTSLLIMRNDTILFERYANGHQKEDPQVIFSVTKGITAILAAIAIKEGKMQPDQLVSDFIPEFAKDARRDIRIRHLLNMVSGINFADKENLVNLSVLYYNTDQDRYLKNYKRVQHRSGTYFAYKSISTQILAHCMEKATGKTQVEYMQEKLWSPLGMQYQGLYTKDSKKKGNHRAYGGLAMRSRDMLRIGKLLLDKGKWEGEQILPQAFVASLEHRDMDEDTYWGYSNYFWRDTYIDKDFLEENDYFAAGFNGQYIYVNPRENVVIVRQGNKEHFRWPLIFGRLLAEIKGAGNDLTDACQNYDSDFEGIYESSNGEKYEILYKGVNIATQQKEWIIKKDINQTLKTRRILLAKRFDGRSIGVHRFAYLCRAIFDVKDGRVVGMYLDDQRAVDMRYFSKKGELSLQQRKELLSQYK